MGVTVYSLTPLGSATFTSSVAGVFTAVDRPPMPREMLAASAHRFFFLATGDTTTPIASISSPEDNAKLIGHADIVGTASDANLILYKLEYSKRIRTNM